MVAVEVDADRQIRQRARWNLRRSVGGVKLRLGEARVDQRLAVQLHVVVVVAEGAVFVLHLHEDDRAAVADLQWSEFVAQALQPARRRIEEARVLRAHDGGRVLQQPSRVAAELPLRADVRSGPQNDPQAFLLRLADELGDVIVAGEVVDARRLLVLIPEDVGGDGVQAHRPRHLETGVPVLAGNARVVHLAGDDAEGFAIEKKAATADRERVWLAIW